MVNTIDIITNIQQHGITSNQILKARTEIDRYGLSPNNVKQLIINAQSGESIKNLQYNLKSMLTSVGELRKHTIKNTTYKYTIKKHTGGGLLNKLLTSILILAAVGTGKAQNSNKNHKLSAISITTSPYSTNVSHTSTTYTPTTTSPYSTNVSHTSNNYKTVATISKNINMNDTFNIDNTDKLFDECMEFSEKVTDTSVTTKTVNILITTTQNPYNIIETFVSDAIGYIPEIVSLQKESYELIKDIPANDVIVIGGHNSMTMSGNPIIGSNQFMSITQQLQACRGMSACLLDIDNAHNNFITKSVNVAQAGIQLMHDPLNPNSYRNSKLLQTITNPSELTSRHGAMPINFSNASTENIYHEIYEFHKANPKVRIDIRVENNNIGPTHVINLLDKIDTQFKQSIYDGSAGPNPTLTQQIESGKMIRFIFEKIQKVDGKLRLTSEGYMMAPDGTPVIDGSFEGFPTGFIYQGASFVRTKWSAITRLLDAAKIGDYDTIEQLLITDDLISNNNVGLIIDAYDTAIGSNISRLEDLTTNFEEIFTRLLPAIRKVCHTKGIKLSNGALIMVDQMHPLHIQIATIFNKMNQIKYSTHKERHIKIQKMKKKLRQLTKNIVPLYTQLNRLPVPIVDGVMKLVHVLQGKRQFNESGLKDIYSILYNLVISIITPIMFSYKLIQLFYKKSNINASNTRKK